MFLWSSFKIFVASVAAALFIVQIILDYTTYIHTVDVKILVNLAGYQEQQFL